MWSEFEWENKVQSFPRLILYLSFVV
jgi:hypothetical protein